jgi:hypothetical protein
MRFKNAPSLTEGLILFKVAVSLTLSSTNVVLVGDNHHQNLKIKRPCMNMKCKSIAYCVFATTLFTHATLSGAQESDPFSSEADIDLSPDAVKEFETNHHLNLFAIRDFNASDLATALLAAKINYPLWNQTKAPAGRDILYLLPHKFTAVEQGGFALNFFFNMTNDMKVTGQDIFDFVHTDDLFNVITSYLPEGTDKRAVQQLLPLFKKITVQERKNGFFWQSAFIQGPVMLQINTSLQLGARNFWLKKSDADAIKAVFREQFGGADLNEHEFYKIRVGMGDTRIKIGLNTMNMTSFQNDIGLETILPTSRLSYTPKVDIGLAQAKFKDAELAAAALRGLFGIRDCIVNPRLGIGHFGLGSYIESKVGIFHEMAHLWIRASYDVLFPSEEDRVFMFKQTKTADELLNFATYPPTSEEEKRARVDQFTQQYLFPSSFKTNVKPGSIVNFVAALNIDFTKNWLFAIGYDFYAQQSESILELLNTNINLLALRVNEAQFPAVNQHKIFSEILYHKRAKNKDFGIGFGGDVTVTSHVLGHDWTVYAKVTAPF